MSKTNRQIEKKGEVYFYSFLLEKERWIKILFGERNHQIVCVKEIKVITTDGNRENIIVGKRFSKEQFPVFLLALLSLRFVKSPF